MFRSPAQLDALRKVSAPPGDDCRRRALWASRGCESGAQAAPPERNLTSRYVFVGRRDNKLLSGWTFDILATDLNDNSLTTAKTGIYGEYALRNTTELLRKKYFKPANEKQLQASDQVAKSLIRFDRVNLRDDSKMLFP